MRGDESQLSTTEGDDLSERRGGRHAAPRKSLLTKLHIPTSKAIALAAMPTAVVVGMGLTPKLAMADDSGDIPFAAGPCVTRSDQPSDSAKPSESPSPSASASSSSSADKAKTADKTKTADQAKDGSASTSAEPSPSPTGSVAKKSTASSSDQSPTASKTKNPLDPLGVGDALSSLLGGGSDKDTASPSPTPSASASSDASKASDDAAKTDASTTVDKTVSKVTDTVSAAAKKTADDTAQKIRDAAAQAGKSVEELPADAKGLAPKADTAIPDGAKPSFPCPTADPKALAAADLEQGIPALPDDAWTLKSSMLTLSGLDYKGIVEVRTGSGKIKKVLKFTSKSVDIKDLHQLTVGPNGSTGHVKAAAGSTSTIRNGTVTMYTESLKGNLFGLIPITFSPETPPPINVPFAFFTNVTVKQAGQFGGTLTVPGLQNYFTGA
ncbi:hypothetical protein AB0M87_01505 [Streptomyces sp. NPDC051320]|uniref:hypothetical protein n=1 Tax=Streptomyces sp. NPDC051320 TaxID=3154644 RepID=UPI0034349DE8